MEIRTTSKITGTLTVEDVRNIISDYFLKLGYMSSNISFSLKNDYSDPDSDRYGPDTIFAGVTANLEKNDN